MVFGGESARGNYAVNVGMMLQSLIPGMEHAEEADVGAEMTWITGDLQQGMGAGLQQKIVDQSFVLQCEWSKLTR